jgi:hypothetical protein
MIRNDQAKTPTLTKLSAKIVAWAFKLFFFLGSTTKHVTAEKSRHAMLVTVAILAVKSVLLLFVRISFADAQMGGLLRT